jgi:uncharacterized membrane protein
MAAIATFNWTLRAADREDGGASVSRSIMRIPLSWSLAKTATFAVVHFSVAFTVAYLLTGSAPVASAIALLEPLANTVAYLVHERAWARVQIGGRSVRAS